MYLKPIEKRQNDSRGRREKNRQRIILQDAINGYANNDNHQEQSVQYWSMDLILYIINRAWTLTNCCETRISNSQHWHNARTVTYNWPFMYIKSFCLASLFLLTLLNYHYEISYPLALNYNKCNVNNNLHWQLLFLLNIEQQYTLPICKKIFSYSNHCTWIYVNELQFHFEYRESLYSLLLEWELNTWWESV